MPPPAKESSEMAKLFTCKHYHTARELAEFRNRKNLAEKVQTDGHVQFVDNCLMKMRK